MANSTGAPSLAVLGSDILSLVLDDLFCELSRQDFYSLAVVDKSFHQGIKRFRGRYQDFHFGRIPGPSIARFTRQHIQDLLEAPKEKSVVSNIRHITITSDFESEDDEAWEIPCLGSLKIQGKWVELMRLLAAIPKLHSFVFKVFEPIPSFLVHQLDRYHPTARLEIHNWTRHSDDRDHTDHCEIALSKSLNLRSIHADLWASEYDVDLRMPALMRIMSLAPNLEQLKIRGEKVSNSAFPLFAAPSPEEKHDRAAQFMFDNHPKSTIKSIKLLGDDYLTVLNRSVDFSFVESLHIDERQRLWEVLDIGGATFDRLRNLTIEYHKPSGRSDARIISSIDSFLLSCRHLESLEIVESTAHNLDCRKIIKYHGTSLKRLALFDNTNSQPNRSTVVGQPCSVFSTLESMRYFCPDLEDIGINAHPTRDGSLDPVTLSMIAGFAPLQILRLRCAFPFEMNRGYDSSETSIESYGTKFRATSGGWIVNLWFFIQARRNENGFKPVKEVHLMYPEHIRTSLGPRSFSLDIVTASERDDRPDEIMVKGNIPGSKETTRRMLRRSVTVEKK
ncbi:hypothetical protein DL98DRAFT_583320 [Cadophora sp. DSE1049]|nr:hypothetical protein DL98DRAFT_583320 [Cadophora sp. DSE1049]